MSWLWESDSCFEELRPAVKEEEAYGQDSPGHCSSRRHMVVGLGLLQMFEVGEEATWTTKKTEVRFQP